MNPTHVIGVDPGLVHTGVVRLVFEPDTQHLFVDHEAVVGPDAEAVKDWIDSSPLHAPHVFIEGYRPRSHFGTDAEMVTAVSQMRAVTHGTVLQNTGVKKVVRRPLMDLVGCWSFSTVTHHQDLRSAARIALFGMLKDEHLNLVLTTLVSDHLDGRSWHVHH